MGTAVAIHKRLKVFFGVVVASVSDAPFLLPFPRNPDPLMDLSSSQTHTIHLKGVTEISRPGNSKLFGSYVLRDLRMDYVCPPLDCSNFFETGA